MNALEIENLTKTFKGKRGRRVEALKSVSFSVSHGEVFGFLGPNGAGKSTTIKILMGLISATSGKALLNGADVTAPLARRKVGYLPENPMFYDFLTAEEYLAFVGRTFGLSSQESAIESRRVLEYLDLWEARKRPLRSYSKGMVQRLGLAQVLVHDPDVYILDEPMSGLDPFGRILVKEMITDLKKRGKCVFFSTHIIGDVEAVCDRVGIINHGNLICLEDVDKFMTQNTIGYRVKTTNNGIKNDNIIQKEHLSDYIMSTIQSGSEIESIEHKTKKLEDYFVELVKKDSM